MLRSQLALIQIPFHRVNDTLPFIMDWPPSFNE